MTNKSLKMTCDVNVIFKNNKPCVNNLLYIYIFEKLECILYLSMH